MELYQRAVQSPDADVLLMSRMYDEIIGGTPRTLREDFCGAGAVCCAWVELGADRSAWGVDLDPEPLTWGRSHNLSYLAPAARSRVSLIQADAREPATPPVDVVCAQNFSYFVFRERAELLGYFAAAHRHLGERGLFVIDVFGGYESLQDEREETRDFHGFEYVWEQHRYNPIKAFGTYKIHFRFPDGSAISDAFVYEWRLWTLPELQDLMVEAGFSAAHVYWEDADPRTGAGTGTYSIAESGDSDPAWNAYVVGRKG